MCRCIFLVRPRRVFGVWFSKLCQMRALKQTPSKILYGTALVPCYSFCAFFFQRLWLCDLFCVVMPLQTFERGGPGQYMAHMSLDEKSIFKYCPFSTPFLQHCSRVVAPQNRDWACNAHCVCFLLRSGHLWLNFSLSGRWKNIWIHTLKCWLTAFISWSLLGALCCTVCTYPSSHFIFMRMNKQAHTSSCLPNIK